MESEVVQINVENDQDASVTRETTYNLYVLSLDPGALNTGWVLFGLDEEKKALRYVTSSTDKFSRFGNNDSVSAPQIAQDADMFVKKMDRGCLKNVPTSALVIVIIENQYVNPSSKFRAGLNLRAMEVALLTAFTCLFRGTASGGRAGICHLAMPRTVNAVMKIEGSKTTSPNYKWQHLVDTVTLVDNKENAVDLSKISKHEADAVWQALWYSKAYLGIEPPFKLSKTQPASVENAPKKRARKIIAKRPQTSESGFDARNDLQGLTGTAASHGDSGHQQVQQDRAGAVMEA